MDIFSNLKAGNYVLVVKSGCFSDGTEGEIGRVKENSKERIIVMFKGKMGYYMQEHGKNATKPNLHVKLKKIPKEVAIAYLIDKEL
jgi:hypothetical protein